MSKLFKRVVVMALCVSLAACGGGGGSSGGGAVFTPTDVQKASTIGTETSTPTASATQIEAPPAPGFTDGVKTPKQADVSPAMVPKPDTTANAGGFMGLNSAIKDQGAGSNNPVIEGQVNAAQAPRQSGNTESFRPGIDTKELTPVPDDKLAPEAQRAKNGVQLKALAKAGDPIQRAQGETVPVAPTPTGMTAAAGTGGHWSGVYNWPLIPIHMAMMPDGRIMSFGTDERGRQTGKTIYAIFDPSGGLLNGHTVFNKSTMADIFCSGQLFLPITNQILTVGGDNTIPDPNDPPGYTNNTGNNSSTIYTPATNTMVAGKNMALPRWYATATTLGDGTTYVQGGLSGEAYPELRDAAGNWKSLNGANTSALDYWYPRNFLHSNGRVFGYDSYGRYYFVSTTGNGAIQQLGQWTWTNFGEAGSAAVFAPGRVLQLSAFNANVSVIDFRGATPTMTATAPLEQRRQNVSAVTMPDGKVVATGGSQVYNEIGPNAGDYYKATIWNPATGTWTIGATTPSGIARLYHSIAMLQPDGSILVGGGGAWGPLSNNNVEFYYPPYWFNADGTVATKPKITAAPTDMNLGQTIQITVDDAGAPVTRLTMLKSPATTHSLNMDQSFNELTFTRNGNVLTAQLPTEVAYATPGYYMIFAVTARGTPSQARMVRMNVVDSAVNAPTNLTATVVEGTGVRLNWTQSTTTGIKSNIISKGTSAQGPWTQIADIAPTTTFTVPDTTAGTYYYTVRATGPTSNPSANSNVATAIVTTGGGTNPGGGTQTAPSIVTGVGAAYISGTGVTLTWTNPAATATMPAVTANAIARATSANGPWTPLGTFSARTNYVDAIAAAGTYYYQITATNSVGQGPAAVSPAVTVAAAPPSGTVAAAATGLSGYSCGTGCWAAPDYGVRFAWTPSVTAGKTNQIVERGTTTNGPWSVIYGALSPTTNFITDHEVVAGTTYWYRVRADVGGTPGNYAKLSYGIQATMTVNTGNPGGGGTTPPVDPGPTLVAPTAPTAATATYATASGVTLNWTNPTASTTMPAVATNTISRGTAVGGPFTAIATNISARATYVDPLQAAGTYYYTITATNSVGTSPAATVGPLTIATTPPPTGIVAVAPTGFSGYTCGTGCWAAPDYGVRVAWKPSTTAGLTSQVVERAPTNAGPWTVIAPALGAAVNYYTDKNVVSGTTYFYRVRGDVGSTPGTYGQLSYGITSNITVGGDTPPPQSTINAAPTLTSTAVAGQPVTLSGSTSTAGTGGTINGYQWTITAANGIVTGFTGATNAVSASLTPSAAGTFTVSLRVVDTLGGSSTNTLTVNVQAAAPTGGAFAIESQGETKYLVMNWWRGDPAKEGDFRDPAGPGACTGPASTGGNCTLGARKTFRPMAFNIATAPATVAGLVMMDVPQFINGNKSYDHYRLPVNMIKNGCTFSVQHVRTAAAGQSGALEFPLNPPGLEILPHKFTMPTTLCNAWPTGAMTQAFLNQLNTALDAYLGPKVAYNPEAYPYSNPRTGRDPSQP